jgi:hypothetical protein
VHLDDVLLDDVEVFEEPGARGADVRAGARGRAQTGVGILEDLAGGLEPLEQRRMSVRLVRARERLGAREVAGALGEAVGTEQLAPERAGREGVGRRGRCEKEARQEA